MKVFKAWRYKCDHCGKNSRQRKSMERHEDGCTMNLYRVCRMHKLVTGEEFPHVPSIFDMLALLRDHAKDEDHGLKALREFVDDCPCCILAALRQSGLCKGTLDEDGYALPLVGVEQFDFGKERESLLSDVNHAREERNYCY